MHGELIKSHDIYYIEGEPTAKDLKKLKGNGIAVGTFPNYSEETLQDLFRQAVDFPQKENEIGGPNRDIFTISIQTPDGPKKFIIKAKFSKDIGPQNAREANKMYKIELEGAENIANTFAQFDLPPDQAVLATPEFHKESAHDAFRAFSVLNEILTAQKAAYRYQKVYGEELLLEKAVGFVVNSAGQKWTVFEDLGEIVDLNSLPESDFQMYDQIQGDFARLMDERLRKIGILPRDLIKGEGYKNVELVNIDNKITPVLIDTEEWLLMD